jgi:hypothetical protein
VFSKEIGPSNVRKNLRLRFEAIAAPLKIVTARIIASRGVSTLITIGSDRSRIEAVLFLRKKEPLQRRRRNSAAPAGYAPKIYGGSPTIIDKCVYILVAHAFR